MKRSPAIASLFAIAGAPVVAALCLLVYFSGWSGGHRISMPLAVFPYAAFFVSGFIAARSEERKTRLACALIAHGAPLFAAILGTGMAWFVVVFVVLAVFAIFAIPWLKLLGFLNEE